MSPGSKMVPSFGLIFYTGLYRQNIKQLLNQTARHRIFILGKYNHVVVIYQVFSNYGLGLKLHLRGHVFYIVLFREILKESFCLKPKCLIAFVLCMQNH